MRFALDAAGPHDPETVSPPRTPGSIRRTTSIDSARPDGVHGPVDFDGRARDVCTGDDGSIEVLAVDAFRARVDPGRVIVSIDADGQPPGLQRLAGAAIRGGFRSLVDASLPDDAARHSLLHLLLDDLPGAILVTGYAAQRVDDDVLASAIRASRGAILQQADICAGWASDASILRIFAASGEVPVPLGPAAPELTPRDDPDAWHVMEPLSAHGMRRRRRLDLGPLDGGSGTHAFDAHFRDSHLDPEGVETALHEYAVRGRLDAAERRIVAIEAQARVLPWVECPAAVASVARLVGAPLAGLRVDVRRDFTGVSTCTHLNDTLRSLEDLEAMLDLGAR